MNRCVIITEAWLDNIIPDATVELDGSLFQSRRTVASAKHKGLTLLISNSWCTHMNNIDTYCSADIEYLVVKIPDHKKW